MSTPLQQKKMAAFVTCIAAADLMEQKRVFADLAAHAGVSPSEYEAMNQQELIACVEQSLKSMVDQVVACGHGPAFKSVSGDGLPVHHVHVDHYVGVHAPHEQAAGARPRTLFVCIDCDLDQQTCCFWICEKKGTRQNN